MNQLYVFISGVAASLVATWLAYIIVGWKRRGRAAKLEGHWAETVVDSERPVSICRLQHQRRGQAYKFSGTNYFPDGREYCAFESENVVFDWVARRMFYIYKFWVKGKTGEQIYGYGWMSIEDDTESPRLSDGHYRSSLPESKARHSRMKPLAEAAAEVRMKVPARLTEEWKSEFARRYAQALHNG
jgi:hypothetical protein